MTERKSVDFSAAARADLDSVVDWYEDCRQGLGAQFLLEVDRAVELAANAPEQFQILYQDIRRARTHRFPYSVFFRFEETRILILGIFHARRNPAIWKRRA